MFTVSLSRYEAYVLDTLRKIENKKIVERLYQKDFTVWSDKPDEISNRLGWLESPANSMKLIDEINEFVEDVRKSGFKKALLLGMGGSSLAPEVFSLTFGVKEGYLSLGVLDSTDPDAVLNHAEKYPPEETLYIVSTKSGGTVETFSFMKFFYNLSVDKLGAEKAGSHFIAITDPGSGLESKAKELKFRKIFLNDPNIGGRYSVLSLFGMVPAALLGINIKKLLDRASEVSVNCQTEKITLFTDNEGFSLGAIIGTLASEGKDKLTFFISPEVESFGAWIEQLVAESSGKNGKGILPVVDEQIDEPENYTSDRAFVVIELKENRVFIKETQKLKEAGFPVIEIVLDDLYDLGREFFNWEIATAVACWQLGVQPFDQPNVESAKVQARKVVKSYQEEGRLPQLDVALLEDEIKTFSSLKCNSIKDYLNSFLCKSVPGKSYISVHAYVKPEVNTGIQLKEFQEKLRKRFKTPVTIGYGPRFLHSTGQLHKGDSGNGLFIQILSATVGDVPIPDEAGELKSSMTFGVLRNAQAMGDRQALIDNNREVISFEFLCETHTGLKKLIDSF